MRGLFRFLLFPGLGALLLAGCCANNACNCQDERADAFYLRFNTRDPGKFDPKAELDTVLVKRFALQMNAKGQPVLLKTKTIDTYTKYADSLNAAGSFDLVTIVRATALQPDTLVLNNNFPFAQSGARKLNTYLYRIEVRNDSLPRQPLKNKPRRYELKDIALKGEFSGDGCCTCYRNTQKTATLAKLPLLSGQVALAVNATETDQKPVYTVIPK